MRGARPDQGRDVVYAVEAGKDLDEVRVGDVVRAAVVEEGDVVAARDQRMSVSIDGALIEVAVEGAASLEICTGSSLGGGTLAAAVSHKDVTVARSLVGAPLEPFARVVFDLCGAFRCPVR